MHNNELGELADNMPAEKDWHIDEIVTLNSLELENRILKHKKECIYDASNL
jgi:hypothetical protein